MAPALAVPLQLFSKDSDLLALYEEDDRDCEREELLYTARGSRPGVSPSFFSAAAFTWVTPLLVAGGKRQLEADDLFDVPEDCKPSLLSEAFARHLEEELAKPPRPRSKLPPVYFALSRTFGPAFVRAGFWKLCSDLLQFFPSIILADYLETFRRVGSGATPDHFLARLGLKSAPGCALVYACLLFVLPCIKTLVEQAYFFRCQKLNMCVRATLTCAVFRKSTRLSSAAKTGSISGEVLNLMQVDASRLGDLLTYLHVLWSAFLQTVGYLSILYSYLSWSTFGGLGMMFLMIPVQGKVFAIIGRRRKKQMALSDKRVKLENETLSGIRIIKLNGWERAMQAIIDAVRGEELAIARNLSFLNALVSSLITTLPTIVAVCAFSLYSGVMHRTMTASITFPALALFNQLRFPLMFFPRVLSMCADSLVSLQRLQKYLGLPESAPVAPRGVFGKESRDRAAAPPTDVVAHIDGGSFHFSQLGEGETPFLRDIQLSLREGTLTVVCGPVGSGKSSLAAALLGDLWATSEEGKPVISCRCAYVTQNPWIQSATVRENVLFGRAFNEQRYAAAVDASCLTADIAILQNGHETEIGERGVTLSGGQKQRVALARALYSDADLYILDDPLSALDAHVGRDVYQRCIRGVLKPKAVLLITHALSCLAEADTVLVMDKGVVIESGTYAGLMAQDGTLARLIAEHGPGEVEAEEEPKAAAAAAAAEESESEDEEAAPSKEPAERMIKEERREEGSVKWSVFDAYARAFPGGWNAVMGLMLLTALKQLSSVSITVWLAVWSGDDDLKRELQIPENHFLPVYALLSATVAFMTYLKSLAFTFCGIFAARKLHSKLLTATLATRLVFFDVTPLGRTLQRFTKDTDTLDNQLPASANNTLEFISGLCSVIITMCIVVPVLIPFLIPLGWLYFSYQGFFRASYREIKRIDAVSGSPVISHFGETLSGISTIRAFGHQERFIADNLALVSANQRAFYAQRCACDRWLPIRLETVGNLLLFLVALLGIIEQGRATGSATVGIALSFALEITGLLSWVIRQWSETEAAIISVERVQEFARLPHEEETGAALHGSLRVAPPGWPRNGALELSHLTMRYQRGMPLVLRDVSASFASGEKVGVVGRTGSGKSSLLVALWRLVEPQTGCCMLDGVDTSSIALAQLRQALTCIPQDPVLFSGSIRHNLDPTGSIESDEALWRALVTVQLKEVIGETGLGLSTKVEEFGTNFSSGQRQLLSLARALLRNTRVVCLDEATASVDLTCDAAMTVVISREFAACTVIVIAHRLQTIIESDTVCCMSNGEMVARGTPAQLLEDATTIFSQLVEETGEGPSLRQRANARRAA